MPITAIDATNTDTESIDIRPGVSILRVLRHLNYKPWYALAEFVDNAVQSYLDNLAALTALHGPSYKLRVSIAHDSSDGGRLTIRDNAAGIHEADYQRAFRAAEVPLDRSGLSEFGMGMKSAACWFGRDWMVRTSALGESVERSVYFNIDTIVEASTEVLKVLRHPASPNAHFTEVVITNLSQSLHGRTIGKIKSHLASIYRVFLRSGQLKLLFNEEVLEYSDQKILVAPYYLDEAEPPREWRKDIDLDLGLGMRAHGFAALRETASTSDAGFALFRRNRLIEGSMEDSYRPEPIFRRSNSFTYQRLFGELHLEGFGVSHTKDGFRWEEHEDIFLEFLAAELDTDDLPLLRQAEGYRVRPKQQDMRIAAELATQRTAATIEREAPPIIEHQIETPPELQPPPAVLSELVMETRRVINVKLFDQDWQIVLELSCDPATIDWLEVGDQSPKVNGVRQIAVRLALAHPFMDRYSGAEPSKIEPLLRVAAALALAEVTARQSGVEGVGTVRRNMNRLLRDALSKP